MRQTSETQQSDWVMPPMFTAAGGTGAGQTWPATGPTVIALNTTPVIIDLTTICGTGSKAPVAQGSDDYNPNPIGHYLTIEADGDDIYYAFGDSVASLGTISPTITSGVTGASFGAGVLATFTQTGSTASGCLKLPSNTSKDFKLPAGRPPPGTPYDNADAGGMRYSPARYLAMRSNTGATVYARIYQSSP